MAKTVYIVREPVEHDHKRFEAGSEIKLDDVQAAPLLALRHIELPAAEAGSNKQPAGDPPAT